MLSGKEEVSSTLTPSQPSALYRACLFALSCTYRFLERDFRKFLNCGLISCNDLKSNLLEDSRELDTSIKLVLQGMAAFVLAAGSWPADEKRRTLRVWLSQWGAGSSSLALTLPCGAGRRGAFFTSFGCCFQILFLSVLFSMILLPLFRIELVDEVPVRHVLPQSVLEYGYITGLREVDTVC